MRKLCIIALFFLTLMSLVLLTSCAVARPPEYQLELPAWPPENNPSWPSLDCWLVEETASEGTSTRIIPSQSHHTLIQLNRQEPVAVLVYPITEELSFFKPAGCILPYNTELSWEQGFSADTLKKLYGACSENSTSATRDFASRFNWSKFSLALDDYQLTQELYNPWLLDQYAIIKSILKEEFSKTSLSQKKCSVSVLPYPLFCDYVPQNTEGTGQSFALKETVLSKFITCQSPRNLITATVDGKEGLSLAINSVPL